MFHVWSEKKFIEKTKITVIPVSNLHISQCSVGSWVIDRTKLFIVITKVHRTQKFLSGDFCKKNEHLIWKTFIFFINTERAGAGISSDQGTLFRSFKLKNFALVTLLKVSQSPPLTQWHKSQVEKELWRYLDNIIFFSRYTVQLLQRWPDFTSP